MREGGTGVGGRGGDAFFFPAAFFDDSVASDELDLVERVFAEFMRLACWKVIVVEVARLTP